MNAFECNEHNKRDPNAISNLSAVATVAIKLMRDFLAENLLFRAHMYGVEHSRNDIRKKYC